MTGLGLSFLLSSLAAQSLESPFLREDLSGGFPDHLIIRTDTPGGYETAMEKLLFVTPDTYGRFCACPAEGAQISIALHGLPEGKGGQGKPVYILTLTESPDKIPPFEPGKMEQALKSLKIKRTDREISRELAVAIQHVWFRALKGARFSEAEFKGSDGVDYVFSMGRMEGKTWTPRKGLMADLVNLSNGLKPFILAKKANEKDLVKTWQSFEAKLSGD